MKRYEMNLFEEMILEAAKKTDSAIAASISLLAQQGKDFLEQKHIYVTEEGALIIIITALAKHRGPGLAKMILQHIEGCSRMYNLMKEAGMTEGKWFIAPSDPDKEEPKESADTVTGSEPAADEPHIEPETVTEGPLQC